MNCLRVLATPVEIPVPPPDGAPLRPGEWSCMTVAGLFGALAFGTLATNQPPIYAVIGILGMLAVFIFKFFQRRHYDRIGWYEKHEVTIPARPFTIRTSLNPLIPDRSFMLSGVEKIIFRDESINLGGVYTVYYSQIREVHTDCIHLCLKGVSLNLTKDSHPNAINELPRILDCGSGERTRKLLALLRAKAPHANFTGPKWVEEGWVPRLGFSYPSSPHGGGGP